MKYTVELKPKAVPYEQFIEVQEALDDFEDLKALRTARDAEGEEPTVPLAEVKRDLGL
jgi:hypothetical protein